MRPAKKAPAETSAHYEIFSDGARTGSEPEITRAFTVARDIADRGAKNVEVRRGSEAWHWVRSRGFLPVLSVERGIPILKAVPDPAVLHVGQVVEGEKPGEFWEVVRTRQSGTDVRCIAGPRSGTETTWSNSSAGHKFVDRAEAEKQREVAVVAKVADRDEHRCPNCWTGEEAVIEGADRGRDPGCKDHKPPREAVERAVTGKRGRGETPEDVAEVLRLRAAGMKYSEIEKKMGWPDGHGTRPWKIVKNAEKARGK